MNFPFKSQKNAVVIVLGLERPPAQGLDWSERERKKERERGRERERERERKRREKGEIDGLESEARENETEINRRGGERKNRKKKKVDKKSKKKIGRKKKFDVPRGNGESGANERSSIYLLSFFHSRRVKRALVAVCNRIY